MMAKSNPSLADLSRMRREARRAKQGGLGGSPHESLLQEAVTEVSSVEATEQEAKQSNEAGTVQQPHVEETKTAELEEQPIPVEPIRQPQVSSDSKLKVVPVRQPSETEEPKKVGRPKGIRSNPEYESTTIRLHKQVKAKARYILSTQPEKMDLQTLLNNLLEDFVRQQKTE